MNKLSFRVTSCLTILLSAFIYFSCSNIILKKFEIADSTTRNSIPKEEAYILQDSEPWEVVTNQSLRSFYVNKPIQLSFDSKSTFKLRSYCLYPIYDIEIWMTMNGFDEKILLMNIDSLPGLADFIFEIPFCIEANTFLTESGKTVSIPKFEGISEDMISLEIKSTDITFIKLSSIKCNWKITFGKYASEPSTGWWRNNALYARGWIAMITNLAYTFSSPEFYEVMFNYKDVTGVEFKPTTENDGQRFSTVDEYKTFYDSLFANRHLNLGVVRASYAAGLGGGSTLGVAPWYFYSHYYGGSMAEVHELGHCMGYGHGSSFCYGEFENVIPNLESMFIRTGELPYPDEDLVAYYSPKFEGIRDETVENSFRRHRPKGNFNDVENWFLAHPEKSPTSYAVLQTYKK